MMRLVPTQFKGDSMPVHLAFPETALSVRTTTNGELIERPIHIPVPKHSRGMSARQTVTSVKLEKTHFTPQRLPD